MERASARGRRHVSTHASAREATRSPGPSHKRPRSFNPRLRAGGDRGKWRPCTPFWCFNPRLRAGGDGRPLPTGLPKTVFQPTPPRGRRHARGCTVTTAHPMFQPTPPRGRRRAASRCLGLRRDGFNPRLRAGGDDTPALAGCSGLSFQPTPPRGRRQYVEDYFITGRMFQPTPPRGRRPRRRGGRAAAREFQPTPPRGRRPEAAHGGTSDFRSFNPRLRAGGDVDAPRLVRLFGVSTHASAREATPRSYAWYRYVVVSTHASAREATRGRHSTSVQYSVFQPTPPRGRRPLRFAPHRHDEVFQPTPPRGRRPSHFTSFCSSS